MALIHFENWQKYLNNGGITAGNDNYLASGTTWTSSIALASAAGPWGEQSATYTGDNSFHGFPWDSMGVRTPSGSTVIIGTWIKRNSDPANSIYGPIILEATTATTSQKHWMLFALKGGGLVLKGRTSGNVDTSAVFLGECDDALLDGVWHYLEVKVEMTNSGSATVKVDGEVKISVSGADMLNDTGSALSLIRLAGSRSQTWYAETIVMDGSGTRFNDFVGPTHCVLALPDADGTYTSWTASAGSRYQTVDDTIGNPDLGTTYITVDPATAPQSNNFSHSDVTLTNVNTVLFAGLNSICVSDVTTSTIRLTVRTNSTDFDSADMPVSQTTYRWRNHWWEVNPDTLSAWTESQINAAEWGIKVTA